MKLRFAATSPFARKARVCSLELGLADRVEQIPTDPWTDPALRIANPLGKVPALELPDGVTLYDSPVVCEFLDTRSEEHTSELQSLMRISYAVFCLKKKNQANPASNGQLSAASALTPYPHLYHHPSPTP